MPGREASNRSMSVSGFSAPSVWLAPAGGLEALVLVTWTRDGRATAARTAAASRCRTRGIIRVLPLPIVGQDRLELQSRSKQPSGSFIALTLVAVISQLKTLGVGFDGFATQDRVETGIES